MLKIKSKAFKFLIGTFAVVALAFAMNVSAAVDLGPNTLKVGSTGSYVMTLQTVVGATPVDGIFGPMTKAKVMAWQANNGLVADGIVGPATKNAMNAGSYSGSTDDVTTVPGCPAGAAFNYMTGAPCTTATLPAGCVPGALFSSTTGQSCTGTTAPVTGALQGAAGDAMITPTSVDIESEVKEGTTEKVLGFRVEAVDSDIQITNLKVTVENTDAPNTSRIPSRYLSAIEIWMGDTKVGTIDPADMSRDLNSYSRVVTLSNAIVRQGQANRANFYVAFKALSNIDSGDMANASFDVDVENIRFMDGSGVVMTSSTTPGVTGVSFTDLASSGDVKLRASLGSNSPAEQLVKASATTTTNDVTLLEFRLKAEGSDLSVESIDVDLTSVGADLNLILADLKLMRGSSTLADENTFAGALTETVTFDLYDPYTIEEGDTETFKVVARIKAFNGAFGAGDTIKASVSGSGVSAEDSNYGLLTGGALVGVASGKVQTFSLGEVTVTNVTTSGNVANNTTKPGYISFSFTVNAIEEDVVFADDASDFEWTVTGTDITLAGFATPVLAKTSGDATQAGGNYTIAEGQSATFVLDFTFTTVDAADNGTYRVTLNKVADVTLDKLSPAVQIAH